MGWLPGEGPSVPDRTTDTEISPYPGNFYGTIDISTKGKVFGLGAVTIVDLTSMAVRANAA